MELQPARTAALTRRAAALAAVGLAALVLCTPAAASTLKLPPTLGKAPGGYRLTALQATAYAERTPQVRAERRRHARVAPTAYENGPGRWQVSYLFRGREVVQVQVDDATGAVVEAWTGPQVAWKMARGYPGAFGRTLNAPYVWLPLCALFLLPFIDPRRPFRLLHLDLLVLLAFGVSHVFFNRGEISTSVPLAYPVLAYLLVRMLLAGFRPRERPGRLVPHAPAWLLAVAIVFLVGFRVGLNVLDSNVIDVGYAGVVGADHIADGTPLYESNFPADNQHGDTYGPANYLLYVPFEQALPWDGTWGDLPAAHGAAIFFDLATLAGLFLLGRRLRAGPEGRMLALALAYAWATYPYTLFALETNSNDALVSMLLVFALLAVRAAPVRGGLLALGAAAKFAPLALAPLFARAGGHRPLRSTLAFAAVLAAVAAATLLPFLPDGGARELYDRTLGYQAGRPSPFSIWGQNPSLEWLHTAVKLGAVGLALLVGVLPGNRDSRRLAALGAAVLIALQLAATHWFYLYVAWFAPFVFVALFAGFRPAAAEPAPGPAEAPERAAREPALA